MNGGGGWKWGRGCLSHGGRLTCGLRHGPRSVLTDLSGCGRRAPPPDGSRKNWVLGSAAAPCWESFIDCVSSRHPIEPRGPRSPAIRRERCRPCHRFASPIWRLHAGLACFRPGSSTPSLMSTIVASIPILRFPSGGRCSSSMVPPVGGRWGIPHTPISSFAAPRHWQPGLIAPRIAHALTDRMINGARKTMTDATAPILRPKKRRKPARGRKALEQGASPTPERMRRAGEDFQRGDTGQITFGDNPLERAFARGTITREQYSVGQKFRQHWYHAGLSDPLRSISLDRVVAVDFGDFSGMAKTERQVFHRQRYREAVQAVGKIGSHVLEWVVCREIGFEQVGYTLGWSSRPQAYAAGVERTKTALDELCRLWGEGFGNHPA